MQELAKLLHGFAGATSERFAHPGFGRARYSVARNTYLACPEKRRPNRPECNGTGERRRSDGDPGEPSNGDGARAGGA